MAKRPTTTLIADPHKVGHELDMNSRNFNHNLENILRGAQALDVLSRQIFTPYIRPIDNALNHLYKNVIRPYEEMSRRILEPHIRFMDNLSNIPALTAIEAAVRSIIALPPLIHPKAEAAMEVGWVVHHTLPTWLLDETAEEDLDGAIATYYKTQWGEVRRSIEANTAGYLIGRDSHELMKEGLEAHEMGLYRLVPRSVLPEIEAVIRKDLSGKNYGSLDMGKEIDKLADVPAMYIRNLTSAILEFDALQEHLYVSIRDDATRDEFADTEIPNRHAAIHGIIAYASEKSSLNSIFLTDFVLQMVSEMKRQIIFTATKVLKDYATASSAGGPTPPDWTNNPLRGDRPIS